MASFCRATLLFVATYLLALPISFAEAQNSSVKDAKEAGVRSSPSRPYSWTGFYIGMNIGLNGGNYQYKPVEVEALSEGETQQPTQNSILNSASGGLVGIQGGYLYQLPSNVVLGVEADFNWTDYRANMSLSEISGAGEAETELAKLRVGNLGTLRARFGYAIGPVLPYLTGGFAFGRTSYLFAEGAEEAGQPPIAKRGRTTWGYTLGGGLEYAVTANLRLKAEYLYTSLASFQAIGLENTSFKLGSSFNTVRLGLNYSFGHQKDAALSTAKIISEPTRFDGLSIGLNAGLTAGSSGGKTILVEEKETSSTSGSFQSFGGIVGAEIGYQYLFANRFVLGGFADYQFTNYQNLSIEAERNAEESAKEKKRYSIPQFGTARLRAGYAMGSFLPYVTGGFAFGRVEFRQAELPIEEEVTPGRINQNKMGYTLGIGAEYAVTSQLFFKTEYLYVNLGRIKGLSAANETISASLPMNIGRVGLTYRF